MNKNRMNLRLFDNDVNIIDRTGAESLIPIQESNEIIQGVIAQSAVLSRGRKLANMTSKQYKMPVLDMLPIAYFVNGDSGQKKTTKQAWDKKFIVAEEIAVIVPMIVEIMVANKAIIIVTYKDSIIPWFLSIASYQRNEKPVKCVNDFELLKEKIIMNSIGA